jgi:hypothetical protein
MAFGPYLPWNHGNQYVKITVSQSLYKVGEEVIIMTLLSAFKKIFRKRKKYDTPNEFLLNPKEKEHLLVFFSIIGMCVIICIILLVL